MDDEESIDCLVAWFVVVCLVGCVSDSVARKLWCLLLLFSSHYVFVRSFVRFRATVEDSCRLSCPRFAAWCCCCCCCVCVGKKTGEETRRGTTTIDLGALLFVDGAAVVSLSDQASKYNVTYSVLGWTIEGIGRTRHKVLTVVGEFHVGVRR